MLLMQKDSPMTVEEIQGLLKHAVNKTTVYRALDSFVEKGILYQTHLRDGKTYYEYQNEHHHHIVCTSCGTKEEVPLCIESSISKISRQSKKFRVITKK